MELLEMKSTMSKMKNAQIGLTADQTWEKTQLQIPPKWNTELKSKTVKSISELLDNFKWPKIDVIGVPGEKLGVGEAGSKNTWRNMVEIFVNLMKTVNLQTQYAQWTSSVRNMKETKQGGITITLCKTLIQRKPLKHPEEKETLCREKQRSKAGNMFLFRNNVREKTVRHHF